MKCETSGPDSTKVSDALFSLFITALKPLCKSFRILFADSSATFNSFFVCLIWSHIFNLASLALISGCI